MATLSAEDVSRLKARVFETIALTWKATS